MTTGQRAAAASHRRARRPRSRLWWVVVAVVIVLLGLVLWIGIRGLMARDALLGAVPLVQDAKSAVLAGSTAQAEQDFTQIEQRASSAASLTSDPVWRAAELVPGLGLNLRASRQVAAMIDGVATNALPPLSKLASTFTLDSFTPKDGRFNLKPFQDAAPSLRQVSTALDRARTEAAAIDTTHTAPQIGSAVDQVVALVGDTAGTLDGLSTTADLLPPMLGVSGPRDYLLMSLNNAELRSTGGIPGALAIIHADNGTLRLGATSSAAALGKFAEPVLPLTASEKTLYTDFLGTYMQDVNMTPNFARTGALAQAMWRQRTGQTVDGVLAVDPVVLSYVLAAVGPVDAGQGVTLTASSAVGMLLSKVYAEIPVPANQDKFFAAVTSRIFAKVTEGAGIKAAGRNLVDALAQSASEQRIHIWSAHPEEQKRLEGSTLASAEPTSTSSKTGIGVYFNDGTGAKMDYYLRALIGVGSVLCRADGKPYFETRVSLTSAAPADAGTSLPKYVTGGGAYGVPPGEIRTNVFVHAPKGTLFYGLSVDGQQVSFDSVDVSESIAGVSVTIAPGKTAQIAFEMLAPKGTQRAVALQHTPMAFPLSTSIDNTLDCPKLPGSGGAKAFGINHGHDMLAPGREL